MGKLERELKAVLEEAFEQGGTLMEFMVPVLLDDSLDEAEKTERINRFIDEAKPKDYNDYIKDIKNTFKSNGWTEEANGSDTSDTTT